MLQFVYVTAVSWVFLTTALLPHVQLGSCTSNTAPWSVRSWSSPARLPEEAPSSSFHLLPSVAVLSFSLPMVPNTSLSLCFYSLSYNHKQQTSIRTKAMLGIWRIGWLQYSEGKPETFPPQTYHLVLATETAGGRQKPQSTASLLWD